MTEAIAAGLCAGWRSKIDEHLQRLSIPQLDSLYKYDKIIGMNQEDRSKAEVLNDLARICHEANKKWWLDLNKPIYANDEAGREDERTIVGYRPKDRNFGELIALCHAELSEALEGHRKNKMDEHIPHRKNVEVELADLLIRVFDLCGGLGFDIAGALIDKTDYNAHREDHKIENRKAQGGKAY